MSRERKRRKSLVEKKEQSFIRSLSTTDDSMRQHLNNTKMIGLLISYAFFYFIQKNLIEKYDLRSLITRKKFIN